MKKHKNKKKITDDLSYLPYKDCLNCGTELKGMFCHRCGQKAVDKTPTVGSFIFEYFDHAVKWDHKFFSTFGTLIRRPGHLTNEYNAGKFTSQEHPLKLNMFLLFVFITLFLFFSGTEKVTNSVQSMVEDDQVFSPLQLQMLENDQMYVQKMQDSAKDTVLLLAPLHLADNYPKIISNIKTIENTNGEALDKWVAVLPQVLIEDKIVVPDDSGSYYFSKENIADNSDLNLSLTILEKMVNITSHYFPILFLLTAPFLSFSIQLVQRKKKIPGINHFIFALHYTAFLEFLMIVVFILHLTINPSMLLLKYVLQIASTIYLAIAYHRVYASTWVKDILKSILTNFIYTIILILIFIAIFIAACIVAACDVS